MHVAEHKQSWKPIYVVLRPNLLSLYRDKHETKLRHQLILSDLTAVARQKDPKRRDKHTFALFSPSKNYHLEASSESEAEEWVNVIRREARIDEDEDELQLASPGGHTSSYLGFERSLDARISLSPEDARPATDVSSSEADMLSTSIRMPKTRSQGAPATEAPRQPSYVDYSGAERASFSDNSDLAGSAARMSALSLANTDPRPSTSSTRPQQPSAAYTQTPNRPSMSNRNASQVSGFNFGLSAEEVRRAQNPQEEERVIHNGWIYLLKSKSGVRQWKKSWLVIRPKGLALYKSEEEYTALLVLPLTNIIDVVEIDPISRSKTFCMQIISEERNYRFCATDEESLARCLGALKSLLSKRKARRKEKEKEVDASAAGQPFPVST